MPGAHQIIDCSTCSSHLAILGDEFAVELHVTLLEVVRELVHVLVLWVQHERLGAVKVIKPEPNDGKKYGKVLLERRGAKVGVHVVCAAEESLKMLVPDH